jgi:hypothetical protein
MGAKGEVYEYEFCTTTTRMRIQKDIYTRLLNKGKTVLLPSPCVLWGFEIRELSTEIPYGLYRGYDTLFSDSALNA